MRRSACRNGFAARLLAAATMAAWLVAAFTQAASAQPTAVVDFDIPAGALADSLDRFGEQSGLQVVYDLSLIEARRVGVLRGTMPPRDALDRVLAGSGLGWRFVNDGTVILRPAPVEREWQRGRRARAPRTDDQGNVLAGLTVVGRGKGGTLVDKPSSAAFGLEKSLLATPRSISSVHVDTIDLLGLSAVEDLVRVVPGVYTTTRWGIQGSIDVRNVPADTYFRGMKRINLQGHGRSVLAAMEAIEIVKGPPSPIVGMGKIGGYTNVVPRSVRAASGGYLSAPQGFVQGIAGSYEKSEVSFGIGGPLPLHARQGGYYVYGLFEDSDSYVERVPIGQRLLQGAISVDDVFGRFRLEAGLNLQRSRTAGALLGRVTQEVADSGRYIRGSPLVDLDANDSGRIGYLEMYGGSPVRGAVSSGNQALRQYFAWPTSADGTALPLGETPVVAGIPESLYDYLVAHPEADPTGLLRAQGPGGPTPISGYLPVGFALDPRTVGFDELDPRWPGAFERELEADFATGYFDLVNDVDPDLTIKNQLFIDGMDQYKLSEQPFSQEQRIYVIEDKVSLSRRHATSPALDVTSVWSVNVRSTVAEGRSSSGDYGTHRGDAMNRASHFDGNTLFATALVNEDIESDGMPWTSRYRTDSLEAGAGALFDITLRGTTNLMLGARVDRSRAGNADYAGTLDVAAGTGESPGEFRPADARARNRDTGVSWSASLSHPLPSGMRPYATVAEASVALDENNNKYNNAVIEAGHIGRARLIELGVKAGLLEDRLFTAAAIYNQGRTGVAEEEASVLDAYASATETLGIEAQLKWRPAEPFLLSFHALRQTTKYSPNVGAAIMVDARSLGFSDVIDADGNVVYPAEAFLYGGRSFVVLPPNVAAYEEKRGNPETQLGAVAQYALRSGLAITLGGNYFSSVYAGRLGTVELPAAHVWNVGVAWQGEAWQVKYDLLNALDERYFRARTGDTLGDSLVSAMPGRRWQLTLRGRF